VTFTSTSTDPDGTVASQAWDTDNDGAFDDGTGASASKTFATPGTYTVRLQATDNNGATNVVSKTVTVGNRPPVASFTVSPSTVYEGDPVTLTSTATDPDGSVATQEWDLDNDGAYDDATGPSATFNPPAIGAFSVGLRVVDDRGAASTVTQNVTVEARPSEAVPTPQEPQQQSFDLSAPIVTSPSEGEPTASAVTPLRWLSPFPTVRMRGRTTRRGAQLSLLTVRGPHGAIAEVRCKGRGCPLKVVRTKLKTKAKRGSATVHFKRFERFLPGGVELQISVSEKGMVGKYTRIKIRKLALPVRTDRCLLPDSIKPTACPVTP
jgi:hypothetical protein